MLNSYPDCFGADIVLEFVVLFDKALGLLVEDVSGGVGYPIVKIALFVEQTSCERTQSNQY